MRRVLLACLVLLAATVLQLTLLNGLPLPGGSPPDLVLVVVVALAVTGGPLEGALAGFGGGLALDIAPPTVHLVGQDALIFCLVGYGMGLLASTLQHSAWLRLGAVAVGAAAGEALLAGIGVMFSEPDITWSAAGVVLPVAVGYEILLAPFVLQAVVRLRDLAGAQTEGGRLAMGGELAAIAAAAATPLAGLAGTRESVRSTGTGRTPRLRSAGRQADGWIGGQPPRAGQVAPPYQRKALNLRLRGGQAGSAAAAVTQRSLPPSRPVNLRLGSRRRDGRVPAAAARAGSAGLGGGLRNPLRPGGGGSMPSGAFRGAPSAGRPARRGLAASPVNLRMGNRRRGDGVLGGSLLGGRRRGRMRSGRGPGAEPKFGSGRSLLGRRRGLSGLGKRGGTGGLGGGISGMLPGTRSPGRWLFRRSRGAFGRRSKVWRIGTGRTGGLS